MEEMTEFQKYVDDRFGEIVYPDEKNPISYEADMDYQLLVNAPEQYEIEPEMLEYAKNHPNATMKELVEYFDKIVPPGLPPCASEWDDDDDDE